MDLLFGFKGRIGRVEWWLGQLALVVLMVVFVLTGIEIIRSLFSTPSMFDVIAAILLPIAAVFIVAWISLATTIKRFHDRNKSGWWVLLVAVPYIGGLWVAFECGILAGDDGDNDFGEPSDGINGHPDDLELGVAYGQDITAPSSIASNAQSNRVQTGRVSRQASFGVRGV